MVGPTLIDIREHIEALATEDGQYYVVCERTGDRPVPAAGNRFPDRATARAAARATEQYRSSLRRYDPQVPYYDLIVCEQTTRDPTAVQPEGTTTESAQPQHSAPVLAARTTDRRDFVDFCHRVAGAVFEALSEDGYDGVENAVMDAYFELAEAVGDPDELCLCLLESMASELHGRLSPAEQANVIADAATRLESPSDDDSPVDATLTTLEQRGVIESYTRSPYSVDLDGGTGSVAVQISGYAFPARDGRLPVLPLTLELCRHHSEQPPQSVQVTAEDGDWHLTFVRSDAVEQNSLVSAPVGGEV